MNGFNLRIIERKNGFNEEKKGPHEEALVKITS